MPNRDAEHWGAGFNSAGSLLESRISPDREAQETAQRRIYEGGISPVRDHAAVVHRPEPDMLFITLPTGTKIMVEGAEMLVGEIDGHCSLRVPMAAFRRNLV